jgi:murein DD-endopeptidase MepM/ murein hydrolase activator NlpD
MKRFFPVLATALVLSLPVCAQTYPRNYFRSPLDIPLQLVANFGEIRANHWHMGLDIRTQQRVNLPVHAAADGYIARVSVEPGGFGQAIYINHPNGYTTVYGHLNAFFPALARYVKDHQYAAQSWSIGLTIPPELFPVKKGELIALSGSTGASEGPHVHFEIRDTRSDKCLNPLLFGFPLADDVPPTLLRLALYDRSTSCFVQAPGMFALKKAGATYALAGTPVLTTSSRTVSFAIGAFDRFSHSTNPNGIYRARVLVDGKPMSGFTLDRIDYLDTRYINAQIDYRYKYSGGTYVQHISPLPGEHSGVYDTNGGDGLIHLPDDAIHFITIEVADANQNTSRLELSLQYKPGPETTGTAGGEVFQPNSINVFDRDNFEVMTTDRTMYDTIPVSFSVAENEAQAAVSPLLHF